MFVKLKNWIFICGLVLLCQGIGTAQDAAKPVLLMGSGYSKHERSAIIKNILEPNEITFEDGDAFVSAELWEGYSLVIVTHGFPKLDEREIGWIQNYVQNGGKLLITTTALSSLRDLKGQDRDWVGSEGYHVVRGNNSEFGLAGEAAKALVPDLETAKLVFGLTPSSAPNKLTTGQPVITRDGDAIVYRNGYGKGEVWFVGFEYFRVINTQKLADAKERAGKAPRDFLERLILQGGVQKKSERIAAGLQALGVNVPVAWRRDFAHARGASFAEPPYPEKDEMVEALRLELGQNEWESVPFNLSSAKADPKFTVSVSGLATADGSHKIAASALRLRVQGVAASHLTVGPFWLLDPVRRDTAAASIFEVPLKANESTTLWLTFNTQDVAPGLYRGQVRFSQAAMKPLELQVQVWPVKLPGREYFQAEATFLWNSLMNGEEGKSYNFPDPPGDMEPFKRHITNLAQHHITINLDNSWTNRYGGSVSLKNARVKDSGVRLEDAIKQGLIKENALPALDLSYFDPFVEIPIQAGMPSFHFNFKNFDGTWIDYSRAITGEKTLAADSPRHAAIKRWIFGEIVGYLRGKGITEIICFIADEIPPDEIPDVLHRAQMLHDFGIRIEFTATGHTGQSREHIKALNPVIDRWIWNAVVMPQAKAIVNAADSPIDKTDHQFTYVADWHRAPYVFNRTRGAFCAYHELDGFFIHGYLRWYPNGGAVWKTPQGPIDTEGWEGARDGIEDARYWKRAQFLLAAAKKNPALTGRAARIEQQMARWVAADANALVELKDAAYSIYKYQSPVSSYVRLQTLKRELLESLQWLQENVPTVYGVAYAGQKLHSAGKSQVQLLGSATAIAKLNETLAARECPELVSNPAGTSRLALGSREELQPLLGNEFVASATPRAGDYQVVVKGNTIAVVGGDEAGLQKGAQLLGQLMERTEEAR